MSATPPDAAQAFLAGGGAMGALMRSQDWSATPLGPCALWPQSLRSIVSLCLGSSFPIAIYWGATYSLLYNDAWSPIPGDKHPWALGRPAHEVWPEIWDTIGPLFDRVIASGEPDGAHDQLLPIHRYGYLEECYFNYTLTPLRGEDGRVEGIFNAVLETTYQVIAERRATVLRELAQHVAPARTADEVCTLAAESLARATADVPFCLLYLADSPPGQARLAGAAGLAPGEPASPSLIAFADPHAAWPLAQVASSGATQCIGDLATRFATPLPGGSWPEPALNALLVPLARPLHSEEPAGFLLMGISPRRALDDTYRGFVEHAATHISAALANARAYAEAEERAAALAEIDRAKTAFFSNVSHEFRTPLTLMLGPLEDLLRQEQAAPIQREQLSLIHRNGLRLLRLVNTLLEFSRIEAGRVEARYAPTDLAMLTREFASIFRSAVERAGLRLTVDCAELGETVYIDRSMWEKIVFNLLSNALKFTFSGEIEVGLRRLEHAVQLRVRDTGTGIPAHELPRLFERFRRVEGARGRSFEGSGIGLSLLQELVQLHGGTVRVDSTLGQGSTFTVEIPLGSAHLPANRLVGATSTAATAPGTNPYVEEALRWLTGEQMAMPAAETQAGKAQPAAEDDTRPRILLADDNADMRDYLQHLLQERYRVVAVEDGEAALRLLRSGPCPDLLLSDVMMPRLDGIALLRAVRAEPAFVGLPVVLLSARAGMEASEEGLEAGADDYLVKPFGARELLARVRANVELGRQRRALDAQKQQFIERLESANAAIAEQNRRLEEASRFKSDFLANMSHELRTPLNAIIGFSEVLRDGLLGELPARPRDYVGRIFDSGQHLLALINDILDLSKVEAGMMTLALEPLVPGELLRASLEMVANAADKRGLSLRLDNDCGQQIMLGDPRKLRQILYNLLSNAVKFSPAGGEIRLEAQRVRRAAIQLAAPDGMATRLLPLAASDADDFLQIRVSDNGSGIAAADLAQLFQSFRQIDSSLSRQQEGTGLGLALVHQLAELHGGTVGVASALGCGTQFSVWLPWRNLLDSTVPADPALLPPDSVDAFAKQALVIEDDPRSAELLRLHLESVGFQVHCALDAANAMQAALQRTPDLITLDLLLPGISGWAVLDQLKTAPTLDSVPVVIVSILADEQRGVALGATKMLQKPVAREALLEVLSTLGLATTAPPATVLVVDDDPNAIDLVAAHLAGQACQVLRAFDGHSAIQSVQRQPPDLLILDLLMPGLSGFEVVDALKRRADTAAVPILVLTAKSISEDERQRLHGRVLQILEKGHFSRQEFLAEVERAMLKRTQRYNAARQLSDHVEGAEHDAHSGG
jgi:signal transduction histidine kinase